MATQTTYKTTLELGAKKNASWSTNIKSAAKTLDTLDQKATKLGETMLAAGTAVAAGATALIATASETYGEFEQEMATVSAISQATGNEYEDLEQAALEAGAQTVYSAEESAEALEYMALAGWDVETSTAALTPVLKLAAATQADLGTTSDLVTDSMGALALGVDDLTGYLDILTSANNNSNTSAEELMEALIKSGGAARALGADLDDTVTSLGILADNGTKAEEAGTSLNSIYSRLVSNTTALKALDSIGVSLFDDNGEFVGWREALIDINEGLEGLTDEEKANKIAKIAGTYRYSQMKYLLDSVVADDSGVSAWDALEEKLNNSTGALDTMYATATDTLETAQENLSSAWEDMQIRVTDTFADEEKEFIQWLADTLPEVTDELADFADAHRNDIAEALESAEEVLTNLWGVASEAGGWLVENGTFVTKTLEGVATAIVGIKAANTVSKAGGVISQVVKFAAGGPLQKVVTIGSLAATAIYEIGAAIENAEQKAIDANLADHFGDIALSMEEIEQLAENIIGEEYLTQTAEVLSAVAESADALDEATDSWGDVRKNSWKIQVGLELDEEDLEEYQDDIASYVEDAQEYVEDKGYEVHVATTLLFSDTDYSGVTAELDTAFATAQADIEKEADELSEYLATAIEDGLTPDEDATVQSYLDTINAISTAVSDAQTQAKYDAVQMKYSGADLDTETMEALQKELAELEEESESSAYEALQTSLAAINYAESTGQYSSAEAAELRTAANEEYNNKVAQAQANTAEYLRESVTDAYPELEGAISDVAETYDRLITQYADATNESVTALWENDPASIISGIAGDLQSAAGSISEKDRKAIQQYCEDSAAEIDALRETIEHYSETGQEVPEEIAAEWQQWNLLEIIAGGDYETALENLHGMLRMDTRLQEFKEETGADIEEAYDFTQNKINTTFGKGYDVSSIIRVDYETSATVDYGGINTALEAAESYAVSNGKTTDPKGLFDVTTKSTSGIASNAEGGIYDKPLLTTFAEEGPEAAIPLDGSSRAKSLWAEAGRRLDILDMTTKSTSGIASNAEGGIYDKPLLTTFAEEGPEAAIPLDGSSRAKSLWAEAGRRLGILQQSTQSTQSTSEGSTSDAQGSSGQWTVVYSPNITVQGSAKQDDIQQALTINKKQLMRMINEIQREQKRTSFQG